MHSFSSLTTVTLFSNVDGDAPWSNNVGCFPVYASSIILGNIVLLLIVETGQLSIPYPPRLGLALNQTFSFLNSTIGFHALGRHQT